LFASSQPKLWAFLGAFSEKGTPMALTDISIKNAKPRERDYKLADGGGLYLLVTVSGFATPQRLTMPSSCNERVIADR